MKNTIRNYYLLHCTAGTIICVSVSVCSDGLVGMAVVGGAAAVAIGGIVGLGIALTRK